MALQEPSELVSSVPWFPVVGTAIGLVVAGLYAGATAVLPTSVAAVFAICGGVLLTGAIHEDGLADVADAFWGGRTTGERLSILKDPRHGTYGVLALAMSVLARIACLASLDPLSAVGVLPATHALSRASAVALMGVGRPLGDGGLGESYARSLGVDRVIAGCCGGMVAALAFAGAWALPAALLAALSALGVRRWSKGKIGGITGDVLGSSEQIAEVLILVLFSIASSGGWFTLWWR